MFLSYIISTLHTYFSNLLVQNYNKKVVLESHHQIPCIPLRYANVVFLHQRPFKTD